MFLFSSFVKYLLGNYGLLLHNLKLVGKNLFYTYFLAKRFN